MKIRESIELKAFAIMLMFWHHLFGCGTFLSKGIQYDWISCIGSIQMDVLFGKGSKLCVPLFAFVSGYGIYKSYILQKNYLKIVKLIFKFLIQYWTVMFIIAIPYLLFFHKFHLKYMIVNLIAFLHNDEILYVSLSWYVKVNLLFLLISPIIKCIDKKLSIQEELFVFIVLPTLLNFIIPVSEEYYIGMMVNFLSTIHLLFIYLPLFYTGIFFSKYDIVEKIRIMTLKKDKVSRNLNAFLSMGGVILLEALFKQNFVLDILYISVFVINFDYVYLNFIVKFKKLDQTLFLMGQYSLYFWLLSGMLFLNTTEFLWLLYLPKYSVFIFIWNFIILIPFVIYVQKISAKFVGFFEYFIKYMNWKIE